MRELEFRAWDKKRKCYAKQIMTTNTSCPYHDRMNMFNGAMTFAKWVLRRYVIEQYTGLKDKNGKEIYEGDVIKVNDDFDEYGINAGEIYAVYFNAGGFRCKPKYGLSITRGDKGFWIDDGNDYEVIGNIHENPDLLEGK